MIREMVTRNKQEKSIAFNTLKGEGRQIIVESSTIKRF